MPKFLFQASYNAEGAKGVAKEGGAGRRAAVEQLVKGLGGTVEAFYAEAVAVALSGNASGVMQVKTTVLLTPEEMDAARTRGASFRAPGR